MRPFSCKSCAAKNDELQRAHERELELMGMIRELQYAIHPARMTKPGTPGGTFQQAGISEVSEATGVEQDTKADISAPVPRGTIRNFPPYVSGLQYGGHVPPGMVDNLRLRSALRKGSA